MLLGLLATAFFRGGWALVTEGLRKGASESLGLLPLLVIIFVMTGFVQVLLPPETVARWLSTDAGWRGIGIAWFAGVLTPGGGPIGLPMAAALLRSGADVGVVVTYVTSLSLLSFIRVPLEFTLFGARVTALRLAVCVGLPPVAGSIARGLSGVFLGR